MKTVENISQYVEDVFDQYGMNKDRFFFDYDVEADEQYPIPLFPNGNPDEETLNRISTQLGISKDEILRMDSDAAKRYWDKYEFFPLYSDFSAMWQWHSQFKDDMPSAKELLIKAIFSDKDNIYSDYQRRYDLDSIRKRLNDKLNEINQIIPGTVHENAEITNLKVKTETFISFPQCSKMVRSFLQMVERLKSLFYRAIKEELSEEDKNELNFLASWLKATDVFLPTTMVTYDNIRKLRSVYADEKKDDFYDYVKIHGFFSIPFWRCREFFDDLDLVQEYANIFPETKGELRQFAMLVSRFHCEFVWSDAKPITFSTEEERELSELNRMFGEEDIPLSERAKERTYIYIDKTPDELGDSEKYTQRILDAVAVSSKGGLSVPHRNKIKDSELAVAITRRFNALRKDGSK